MTTKQKRKRTNLHKEEMRDKIKSYKILKWYNDTHIIPPTIDGQGLVRAMAYMEFDKLPREEQRKILN